MGTSRNSVTMSTALLTLGTGGTSRGVGHQRIGGIVHRGLTVGTTVRLRAPRALRNTVGTIVRILPSHLEIEFRTPLGTPVHVVAAPRQIARIRIRPLREEGRSRRVT